MLLPEIENNPQPGGRGDMIRQMRDSSKDWMFALFLKLSARRDSRFHDSLSHKSERREGTRQAWAREEVGVDQMT